MCVQELAYSHRRAARGFTLIELIVGITLVAIAATLFTKLIVPAVRQSAEPLVQQRAASLAEALMDEILSKRYDENTPEGGVPPCSASTTPCSTTLGPDTGETSRADYDDVDDYNVYCGSGVTVTDANGTALANYSSFRMSICVSYDTTYTGVAQSAKRITVTVLPGIPTSGPPAVTPPPLTFTAYRMNF